MGKTVTVRANRSFSTINQGDVITVDETDARMQAFLNSGYLTEVEGDDAKGAKKLDAMPVDEPEVVWDGKAGNRRGTTAVDNDADPDDDSVTRPVKVAKSTAAKDSNGAG
jgi:hypothetical protein